MPRTLEYFQVVSPETVADEGPARAFAPSVFPEDYQAADRLVELPPEVDGFRLHKGMTVRGMAHIFVKNAAEVRPHDLHVVIPEDVRPAPSSVRWD